MFLDFGTFALEFEVILKQQEIYIAKLYKEKVKTVIDTTFEDLKTTNIDDLSRTFEDTIIKVPK